MLPFRRDFPWGRFQHSPCGAIFFTNDDRSIKMPQCGGGGQRGPLDADTLHAPEGRRAETPVGPWGSDPLGIVLGGGCFRSAGPVGPPNKV